LSSRQFDQRNQEVVDLANGLDEPTENHRFGDVGVGAQRIASQNIFSASEVVITGEHKQAELRGTAFTTPVRSAR
jgi:hypothetical protein